MNIPAVCFSSGPRQRRPQFNYLSLQLPSSIDKLQIDEAPRVYVIEASSKAKLFALDKRIKDLKSKHPRVELFKRHRNLGRDQITVIDGGYQATPRSLGQLKRSIDAFLNRLVQEGRRTICFIAVDDAVLRALKDSISEPPPESGPISAKKKRGRTKPGNSAYHELAHALERIVVPPDLERVYVGVSDDAQFVRQLIVLASKTATPVLVQGETGTGKERVARAIHELTAASRVRGNSAPFRAVNCGAIPSELLESELFGCEPYVHSMARERRIGIWQSANGGTLFLDEIGELRPDHQVKVLRALQENKVRPVGLNDEVKVTARIIAATNRDLDAMVRAGKFRSDLYYRLRMFYIPTTSLRDHSDDVSVLAQYFWRQIAGSRQPPLSPSVIRVLSAYPWPGNARELQGVLTTCSTLFPNKPPTPKDVTAVMKYLGKSIVAPRADAKAEAEQSHRFACLRHLKRAGEALHTLGLLFGPAKSKSDRQTAPRELDRELAQRCIELERLSRKPLMFYSSALYQAFERLREKSNALQEQIYNDRSENTGYWRGELKPQLEVVQQLLFEQAQQLLRG